MRIVTVQIAGAQCPNKLLWSGLYCGLACTKTENSASHLQVLIPSRPVGLIGKLCESQSALEEAQDAGCWQCCLPLCMCLHPTGSQQYIISIPHGFSIVAGYDPHTRNASLVSCKRHAAKACHMRCRMHRQSFAGSAPALQGLCPCFPLPCVPAAVMSRLSEHHERAIVLGAACWIVA